MHRCSACNKPVLVTDEGKIVRLYVTTEKAKMVEHNCNAPVIAEIEARMSGHGGLRVG